MIEGGPGWHIDPVTLRPVITDEQRFRDAFADDPALEAIVALWSGDPASAMVALTPLLDADPDHWRWRALRADIRRDLGDHDAAVAEYTELVAASVGMQREAVLLQHLGKVHFAAGDDEAAASCFVRALDLRTRAGVDPALIESSSAALEAALSRSRRVRR